MAEGGFGDGGELRDGESHFCEGESVLGEEAGAEHGGVVRGESDGHAASDKFSQRVIFNTSLIGAEKFGEGAGAEIAGGTDFERDLALDEQVHQAFVLNGGDAVADAFRAKDFDGVANGLRATHFSRVRDAMDAFRCGIVEDFAKVGRWKRLFVAAEAESDDSGGFHLRGEARDFHGFFRTELAYRVQDPVNAQIGIFLVTSDGVENDGEIRFDILLAKEHHADGEGDFSVDAVFGEQMQAGIFAEEGVILGIAEVRRGPFEKIEEGGEGLSVVALDDAGVIEFFAMTRGETDDLHGIEAAFEMKVQFSFGKADQRCGTGFDWARGH